MTQNRNHLTVKELAARWGLSSKTLDQWRWKGNGPSYLKIEGRVRYRLEDISAFENQNLRHSTSQTTTF